jgi:acyl-CoA dehydrogenase
MFARTADRLPAGHLGVSGPGGRAGVSVGPKNAKMGQEEAWTADVSFAGMAGTGGCDHWQRAVQIRAALAALSRSRVPIAALAVGSARRALDESVAYAAAYTQGGRPIGEFQLVQAMLADQYTGVAAGRAMVRETAGLRLRLRPPARAITGEAVLHGDGLSGGRPRRAGARGTGHTREIPVERISREVRLLCGRQASGQPRRNRLTVGHPLSHFLLNPRRS